MSSKSEYTGSETTLFTLSESSEAKWFPRNNSRLYSAARMRRRAMIEEKINDSPIFVPSDLKPEPEEPEEPEEKYDKDVPVSEVEPTDTQNMTPEGFYERKGTVSSTQISKRNSPQVKFSFVSVENVFNSRTSFSERGSESSGESIDSQTKPTSNIAYERRPTVSSEKISKKIKTLATLLPDELLFDPTKRKPRPYSAALMFPDVSGFTLLCEKYDKTGKGGPSRLTEVLNGYIGSMIKIVISRNGDVCKFGGDAFLCVWKVTEGSNLKEIVQSAIDSAVDIQKKCGETKTDVGVNLGVKIAVAAGKVLFSIIGTETRKYYVVVGPPLMEVRDAERLCKQGDVIVAPSAWKHIQNYMFYSYTYHSDNSHIKVHDFGPLWKSNIPKQKNTEEEPFLVRPAMKNTSHLKIEDIKPFILPPVMRSTDLNQGFDYLTEMRQVAIVFINVIADFNRMALEDIIELSNKAFQTVTGIVDRNDGSVNKLNLFDKDMAILVVFGLKGFKHELSSQVALKCAYNCMEQLKKLKVMSVSAGVTTGMAYCGVIGHTLRREYTVMGHPVNLAARLMCAFLNIVSSDRNTFLHSRLESGHFELLEQKFLKGIENPGPFYKFSLHPKRNKLKLDFQECPLLGRTKEIKQFEQFLEDSKKKDNVNNFMAIYGNARIGKSRLIAKFINIAEKFVYPDSEQKKKSRQDLSKFLEIYVIPLTEDDSKSAHSASRLLFQYPLGLSESSSVEEREDKILSKLGELKDIKFLASLNPIFNVNFDLLPQYLDLNQADQANVQEVMVKNLYKKCFPKDTRWLIVIEDAEFMDEKSWNLLKWCASDSYKVLFVITIGQRKALSNTALECLEAINPKKIVLKEIDKWFYAGLACQILGVRAIPAELVNLLQTYKSSGNPGWLESFLLSLTQSGCITIAESNSRQIKNLKLVAAPEDMVSVPKMTEDEKSSSTWLEYVGTFEPINTSDRNNVPVCLLGPKFFGAIENQTELTMDLMFIRTIDTLKPLEQLVLKAGSVLGNSFERTALKFIVTADVTVEDRQLAKAIRNLFEIRIITCAKGDLTNLNLLAPRRMILATSIGREVKCECIGVTIPEDCKDLPLYANCGYMQFRSTSLRDTVYNLLLDDQKKKFHNSSIEYLRKNTYKCKSCNSLQFTNLFGSETNGQVELVCTVTPMHGVRSTKLEPKNSLPIPSLKYKLANCSFSLTAFITSKGLQSFESEFGLIFHKEVVDCQCSQILSSVYSVLLEHAAGAGRKDLTLEIQLEYASVSLTSYNIPLTMQILEEALDLLKEMSEEQECQEFCSPYIYGKIYTLMGATKLCMGRPEIALGFLEMGLNYMEKDFPKSAAKVKVLIKKETLKRKFMTEYFPKKFIGSAHDSRAPLSDLLSECLGLISLVHLHMKNRLMAKYASLWALNKALESNRNFYGLCVAYTNMMEIAYYDNDVNTCAKMEICAIDVCKRCTERINEVYELEAVCRLYGAIFQTRHARAEIEEAVLIGFQSIRISTIIRSTTLTLDLMPDLIFALIQLNRHSEAVSLLQELEFLSLLDSDKSSRIWYYAICLDFQLDTGYTVLPYETCQKFVKEEEENFVIVRDPDGKHRLYTSLWLWCLRFDEWELSKPYAKILKGFRLVEGRETPRSVFTRLKRLEGFLITLVHKMDTRNIYSINATYTEIHSLMNKLEKDTKVVKILKPRYLLLKAYYRQIRYRDESYVRQLTQALSLADRMKDKNTSDWIVQLKMVWSNTISPIQRNFWLEHCKNNLIYWHESEGVTKIQTVMYSFPLPKF